jgi:cleavage stimulation factor subunit 3
MADNSAEFAFLQSMQDESADTYGDAGYNPETVAAQPTEEDEDEDYDPASLMPEDSYDPEQSAVNPTATEAPAASGDQPSANGTPSKTQQPRTMGGFVVDDDDEEEDSSMLKPQGALPSGHLSAARATSQTPQRSLTHTPNTSSVPANVPVQLKSPLQDQNPADAVANGNAHAPSNLAAVPLSTDTSVSAQPETGKSTPQPQSATVATAVLPTTAPPKGRLPHDRVGILEDRVREDPRGDVDAWLELIGEYRKRNKTDDARNAYDRFFKIFPEAVSILARL